MHDEILFVVSLGYLCDVKIYKIREKEQYERVRFLPQRKNNNGFYLRR